MMLGPGHLSYRTESRKKLARRLRQFLAVGRQIGRVKGKTEYSGSVGHPTNSTYTSTHAVGRKRRSEAMEEVIQDGPVIDVFYGRSGGGRTGNGRPQRVVRRREIRRRQVRRRAGVPRSRMGETRQQSARISNRIRTLRGRCQSFFSMNAQHPTDSNSPRAWHRPYMFGRPRREGPHVREPPVTTAMFCAGNYRPKARTRAPHKRIENKINPYRRPAVNT